ncbi:uncharacterized protein LOC130745072 [Lotus japonicus]|uniref:uncharacterized protein LOC130745072 n=1 Tax=Lotus japonicus TaxID=34305 RepID=UPI00259091F2|nr:uncharacterized protein LOC130745072 [Lotus japonicus]
MDPARLSTASLAVSSSATLLRFLGGKTKKIFLQKQIRRINLIKSSSSNCHIHLSGLSSTKHTDLNRPKCQNVMLFLTSKVRERTKEIVLNDLYYHLQGELEGRKIGMGPFKELSQYLLEANFLGTYQRQFNEDFFAKNVYLFDLVQLRADLRLNMWDCSDWRTSKEIAETILRFLQDANSVMLLSSSKLSALKGLTAVLAVYHDDVRV